MRQDRNFDTIDDMMTRLDARGYDAVLVVSRRVGMSYADMPPDDPEHVHATLAMRPPWLSAAFLLNGVKDQLQRFGELSGLDIGAQLSTLDDLFQGMNSLLPEE